MERQFIEGPSPRSRRFRLLASMQLFHKPAEQKDPMNNASLLPPSTPPTLSPQQLARIDAYWRAANYLSVGQIYLYDNPLLRRPLALPDIKRMLLGHWGTTPGQNFIYAHLNRVIRKYDWT